MIDLGSINSFFIAYEGSYFSEYAHKSSLIKGKLGDWATVELVMKSPEDVTFVRMLELETTPASWLVGIDQNHLLFLTKLKIVEDRAEGRIVNITKEEFEEKYREANAED